MIERTTAQTRAHLVEISKVGAHVLHTAKEKIVDTWNAVRSGGVSSSSAGSIRDVNPLDGTNNCLNCAVATDARLAGYPASALDVPPGVRGQPISILEDIYGNAFKSVTGQSEIASLLTDAGPGARGIVFGSRGPDPGHVFNAVNQNGVIRFLDGQSGGVASFEGYTGFQFLRTN